MTKRVALSGYGSMVLVSEQALWNDIFAALSQASIDDFSQRICIREDADTAEMVVKFAFAVNLLLNDLGNNQEYRVRGLAEQVITQVAESQRLAEESLSIMREYCRRIEMNNQNE